MVYPNKIQQTLTLRNGIQRLTALFYKNINNFKNVLLAYEL